MLRNRRQSGEGQLGCIFGLIFLVAALYVTYKMVPVKVRAAELRGTVADEAKSAGTHHKEEILAAILAKAKDENLPVTEKDIKIERTSTEVRIEVEYTVPIEFPGFTYQWHQKHKAQNPVF